MTTDGNTWTRCAWTDIPVSGVNLVGLDDFDLPGEQFYLIGNFPTMEESLTAQAAWSHSDKTYIYKPKANDNDLKNP